MRTHWAISALMALVVVSTAYWLTVQQASEGGANAYGLSSSGEQPNVGYQGGVYLSVISKQKNVNDDGDGPAVRHQIPLTNNEWNAVRKAAAHCNESVSDFVRQRLLSSSPSKLQAGQRIPGFLFPPSSEKDPMDPA